METTTTRSVLAVAGLVAVAVGVGLLVDPVGFEALNDVVSASDTNSLSEARGTGGGLVAVGGLVLAGAVVPAVGRASALLAALVYLGYGLARLVSIAVDGVPSAGIVVVAAAELTLSAACAALLRAPSERQLSVPV